MRQLTKSDYLLLKSASRSLIKSCGGLEAAADVSRVRSSVLSDYCHIDKLECFMPLDVAADLQSECGAAYVSEALSALSGGSFSPRAADHITMTISEAVASVMSETSDVLKSVSSSIRDGHITPRERADIVKQIQDTIHACTDVLSSLDFNPEECIDAKEQK